MNKTIKKYIGEVKRELCCPFTIKMAFISHLKKQIKDLFAGEEVTTEMLHEEFGAPKDIANGFMNYVDMPTLRKKAVLYRSLFTISIGILIVLVVVIIAFLSRFLGGSSATEVITNY